MRLTTSRYYTPSGRSIQEIGVTPDIIVEAANLAGTRAKKRTREGDLRGALKNDNNKNELDDNKNKTNHEKNKNKKLNTSRINATSTNNEDFQLQRALDLLQGVSMFSQRIKG